MSSETTSLLNTVPSDGITDGITAGITDGITAGITDIEKTGNYSINNSQHFDTISTHSNTSSNQSGSKCRICLENLEITLQYCECLNTLSFIHQHCLFKWLLSNNNSINTSNKRNQDYNNHDDTYDMIIHRDDTPNKLCCSRIQPTYYYCEICHYRYNLFSIPYFELYYPIIAINTILLIGIIGIFIYTIHIDNYNSNILFVFIKLIMLLSIIGSIFQMCNFKLNTNFTIRPYQETIQ